MLSTIITLLKSECLLLWRRAHEWLYPIAFFVMVLLLFPLAFSPDPVFLTHYLPGCVWIAALLGSLLSIETIFYTDIEDGLLEQLLISETPFAMILLAKLAAQWVLTELPLILLMPVIGVMFGVSFKVVGLLMVSLLLGTPILTCIGCFGVALTIGLKQQGALLGLLILPLSIPVLIFGVNIVQQAALNLQTLGPIAFLAGLCVLAIVLLPVAIAETIRIGVGD